MTSRRSTEEQRKQDQEGYHERKKSRKLRRERVPLGQQRMKLDIPKTVRERLDRNGLVPRWCNDDDHGGNIMDLKERGYEFVKAEEGDRLGKSMVDDNGHIVRRVGSQESGSRQDAYLMATYKEIYEEDQRAKEEVNSMVDEAILAGKPKGSKDHNIPSDLGGTYVKEAKIQAS